MIKYILLFSICLINISYAQKNKTLNIKYKAVYNYISKPDSTKNSILEQKMILYVGEKFSLFQNFYKEKLDSVDIAHTISKGDIIVDLSKIKIPKINYIILKDNTINKIVFTEKLESANIGYIDDISDLNWQITNEKTEINGYNCIKAKTFFRGRHFIAWFTQEIPFQDGPYKFSKLPGFIIQLKDAQEYFIFNLISFERQINKQILYDEQFFTIDKKDYYIKKINYYNNLFLETNKSNQKMKKITYNPIELKL